MKYTILGFNQEVALSFKSVIKANNKDVVQKIDTIDLMILRWIVDFSPKMKRISDGDNVFFWVEYSSLLEDMPLLDIGRDALYRRLKKMASFDILTHHCVKMGGTFSCYGFGSRYIDLLRKNEGSVQTTDGTDLKPNGSVQTTEQIIPPLYPSIKSLKKDTKVSKESEKDSSKYFKEEVSISPNGQEEITPPVAPTPPKEEVYSFEEFWEAYDKKNEKKQCLRIWGKISDDDKLLIKQHVLNYVSSTPDKSYRKNPQTYLNGECWNDEIIHKPTSPSRPPRTPEPAPPLEVLSDDDYDTGGLSNYDYLCKMMEQYEQ